MKTLRRGGLEAGLEEWIDRKKRREGIPDRGDRRARVWLKRVIKGWQDGGSDGDL